MSSQNVDAEFARRSKEVFDRQLAQLDGATRSKLREARLRAAREAASGRTWAMPTRGWVAAGTLAAFVLAVVTAWWLWTDPTAAQQGRFEVADSGDLELLLDDADLDMVQELEFYAWLEQQTDAPPPAPIGDEIG